MGFILAGDLAERPAESDNDQYHHEHGEAPHKQGDQSCEQDADQSDAAEK